MKKQYGTYLPKDTIADFEQMCGDSMEPTRYLAAWVTELSKVRPEFALKVLGIIPPEWKKRSVGRPPSSTRAADNVVPGPQVSAQDVA